MVLFEAGFHENQTKRLIGLDRLGGVKIQLGLDDSNLEEERESDVIFSLFLDLELTGMECDS